MRFTSGPALGSQRGVSLIEALVASALLGIGVVAALTAWDAGATTASKAVRQAWARCTARSELDAILAAPYSTNKNDYPTPSSKVQVSVQPIPRANPAAAEELVTVSVVDPQSNQVLFEASALKVSALAGEKSMWSGTVPDINVGCPAP